MAKFTPGPAVAAVSGSVGGTVFSRNRFGAYMRFRAKPVISTTEFAQTAKSILAAQSQRWQTLDAEEQAAWRTYAQTHPVTDRLGNAQVLTGQQAFVQINARLDYSNNTLLDLPPVADAPDALTSLTGTFDIGAGAFVITFTPTPLPANVSIYAQAAVVNSAGISYIKNLLKLVSIQAGATASPIDLQTAIEARFGSLQVGQSVHIWAATYDRATGLLSNPLPVSGVVVST